MAHYSIKELAHLSGIKAHTIRVWEQRYEILSPKRTETNIRFYNDSDLKILLNISALNEKGYKISRIAKLSAAQISEEVIALTEASGESQLQVNALVLAMLELDEERFEKAINTPVLQLGFEKAMLQVVYPFLNKIGILWQTNNICPAHEHFVSNLIRQKLIVAIDGQVQVSRSAAKASFLLFLPEGELHELALLFMTYLLRVRQCHALYLGQNLPYPDLLAAQEKYQANYIATVLTTFPEGDHVQTYLDKISKDFAAQHVWVYGYQVQTQTLKFPDNVKKFALISDFIAALENL